MLIFELYFNRTLRLKTFLQRGERDPCVVPPLIIELCWLQTPLSSQTISNNRIHKNKIKKAYWSSKLMLKKWEWYIVKYKYKFYKRTQENFDGIKDTTEGSFVVISHITN